MSGIEEKSSFRMYCLADKITCYEQAALELGYSFEVVGRPGEKAPDFFDSKIRVLQPNERIIHISGIQGNSFQPLWKAVEKLTRESRTS